MQKDIDVAAMLSNAENAAKWLKAIANPYRLMILCLLLDQELSVTQLNETVPLSQSALSQHLDLCDLLVLERVVNNLRTLAGRHQIFGTQYCQML